MPETIAALVDRARAGLDLLATKAEPIEDEWQYVTDLGTVWGARLSDVAVRLGDEPAPDGAAEAMDALLGEAARIEDPHLAIDWLSTFPQVALLALGEDR